MFAHCFFSRPVRLMPSSFKRQCVANSSASYAYRNHIGMLMFSTKCWRTVMVKLISGAIATVPAAPQSLSDLENSWDSPKAILFLQVSGIVDVDGCGCCTCRSPHLWHDGASCTQIAICFPLTLRPKHKTWGLNQLDVYIWGHYKCANPSTNKVGTGLSSSSSSKIQLVPWIPGRDWLPAPWISEAFASSPGFFSPGTAELDTEGHRSAGSWLLLLGSMHVVPTIGSGFPW